MVYLQKRAPDQHGTKQRDLKTGDESFILYLFWIVINHVTTYALCSLYIQWLGKFVLTEKFWQYFF